MCVSRCYLYLLLRVLPLPAPPKLLTHLACHALRQINWETQNEASLIPGRANEKGGASHAASTRMKTQFAVLTFSLFCARLFLQWLSNHIGQVSDERRLVVFGNHGAHDFLREQGVEKQNVLHVKSPHEAPARDAPPVLAAHHSRKPISPVILSRRLIGQRRPLDAFNARDVATPGNRRGLLQFDGVYCGRRYRAPSVAHIAPLPVSFTDRHTIFANCWHVRSSTNHFP